MDLIIPKIEMNADLRHVFDELLSAPQHKLEHGPVKAWRDFDHYVYGFIDSKSYMPVAVVEASGRPRCTPGWWINSALRGRGLGNDVIDLLADYLKKDGVEEIGPIPIDGKYYLQSAKLAARLRNHFTTPRT